MDIDEVLKMVLKKLNDIIFEVEQIREIKEKKFTIEVKDSKGNIIKTIKIKL